MGDNGQRGMARHENYHTGQEPRCDRRQQAGQEARDARIRAEAARLRRLQDGPRWAEIREAQERAGRDDGAMLTIAAAAELYTPEWRRMCR